MASEPVNRPGESSIPATLSWDPSSLDETSRASCLALARSHFPFASIEPLPTKLQGGCSFTVMLSSVTDTNQARQLLQFRPTRYALNSEILNDARTIYGRYAPQVRRLDYIDLEDHGQAIAYLVDFIQGTSLRDVCPVSGSVHGSDLARQLRYVTGFADFLARGWQHVVNPGGTNRCSGKVGSCLKHKVHRLTTELPTSALRTVANQVHRSLHLLDRLPVVLCHGDMIPSNILIDETTASIQGFIDWAEAEYLPFGLPLYGLEYFLGYLSKAGRSPCFTYYESATDLRQHFWKQLEDRIPEMSIKEDLKEAIMLARDVGVLLWYGFAWDDGAINRVVNPKDDPDEITYLETFLSLSREEHPSQGRHLSRL